MPNFNYVAIDKAGKRKKGTLEVADEEKAYARLKAEGLLPLEVKPENLLNKEISFSFGGKVKSRDLSVFCRQFVSMITAGVTILDALGMLSEQTENKALSKALKEVQVSIEKGETLSDSMRKQEKVFPPMLINMVAAGEASGSLETAFGRMATQFEKSAKLQGLIKKASVYPMVIGVVAIVVVIVMLAYVIPNFADIFEQLESELPGITKATLAMSDFVKGYWYLIIIVVAGTVVGLNLFRKTENGQIVFGKIGYKIPIFGKLTVKSAASQFARTLSTLLSAGIPMIEALDIVGRIMNNALFRDAILGAKEDVARGIPLSEPLESCGLFPPMVYHMTRIGEETGDMGSMLERLADYYDEEVEMTTQTVMAALEPMIIIVMALVVGVLIAAIMAPMAQMYQDMDSL